MSNLHPIETREIDLYSEESLRYWMKELNVCEISLRNAVFIAGKQVAEVRKYLDRRQNFNGNASISS